MSERSEPTETEEGAEAPDDVKQRFREALERKQAKNKQGEEHADGLSKVHNAHGPVAAKRTFRRKSG